MSTYYQRADLEKLRTNVPLDMRNVPAWVLWKEVSNDKSKKKPDKVPYYADGKVRSGKLDDTNDRNRLVTFDEALSVYQADQAAYMGPGFVLGQVPDTQLILSGIDLDNSVDTKGISPKAQSVVDTAASYTEISPGQHGFKIFGTGDIGKETGSELEIYSSARYFTVTGQLISGDHLADLKAAATLARELLLQNAQRSTSTSKTLGDGQRHIAFMSFLGTLRARGLTDKEIEREARKFNEERCIPPMSEVEFKRDLASAMGWKREYALNDTGNAHRILDFYGPDVHWVMGHREFIVWTADGWITDAEALQVTAWAKESITRGFAEVMDAPTPDAQKRLSSHLIGSQNTKKLEMAVINIRSEYGVALDSKRLDADSYLVGVQGGHVLDVRTGDCRTARREDYITKRLGCSFDPKATAPKWLAVLKRAMKDDPAMIEYLQQVVGMSLMGNPLRLAFLLNGPTGTAKSLFIETVKSLLNDYACAASRSLLMAKANENRHGPTEELVRLAGKKLVTVSEVKEGDKLDDSVFKDLLGGGDEIAARGVYKSSIEFRPNFVLMVRCNHRPKFNGDDDAVLSRIHLIPFTQFIPMDERDFTLMEAIRRDELSGVLNWSLEGALKLQENKFQLTLPERVQKATAEYGVEMNPIGQFIEARCTLHPDATARAGELFLEYRDWCKENDREPGTLTAFGLRINQRFEKKRGDSGFKYHGIRVGREGGM